MNNSYNVLTVDDDREIVESISIFLKGEGYNVFKAYNGRQAIETVMEEEIHIMILDIMMPETDGIQALLKIRENKNIPIILLSAKSENKDKILGLTAGADDYVTKPFDPSELMARVKSQLRRYTSLGSMEKSDRLIVIGGITVDLDAKKVTVDGEVKHFTPIEYKILTLLCQNMGKTFSAGEIYERIWNGETAVNDSSIAVHIRHIREKIEINPREPKYLKVVWGIGYKMEGG
ncbi:MAG: response regulator transcription factor [Clostridiales bacterium]|nr:response regulator transcription factor [Clostridiales bacterium]